MSTHCITHTKNATQHPGLADMVPKKKCCMAAEVAAERQAKLDAKEEKKHAKAAGIKCVAEYEKKQADKDASTNTILQAAALPKSKPCPRPIPKKIRAKPSPPPEDDGFISDVEMDDAVIDTSAFNSDPSQASETDTHMDGSELSETYTLPPKKKARVDKREGRKTLLGPTPSGTPHRITKSFLSTWCPTASEAKPKTLSKESKSPLLSFKTKNTRKWPLENCTA
ncbi:uncharacterized protein F5891DRAFT_1180341 [Suillus fuscotomentosus]|uniref:Uncharacterized protein n=1 Tax=Suillus fuscotomentosus TaxID=1912939 RepID=A0AAD4EM85_9AGAM|nr:uncharacterized protein F5891DRAFT_1180341 [Suillus fuscotomentosus]KAG1908783.1 hypothetical protein F5891DRAFT_1180341 [Suillus fuscotomentosus]